MTAMQEGKDFQMGAILVIKKEGEVEKTELLRKQINGNIEFTSYSSEQFDLKIDLVNLSASNIKISISKISEVKDDQHSEAQEILYVSASIKPFISFVWVGVAVMVFGFFIALARRLPESLSKS